MKQHEYIRASVDNIRRWVEDIETAVHAIERELSNLKDTANGVEEIENKEVDPSE